ncbi:type II secretion system secretin GspD [Massilia sp. W12]|uniref:type II secretion system secretin GspD n=1 Tax=Massilia sp. W12 TaxID=3126507 RepID=UPI0030D11BFC
MKNRAKNRILQSSRPAWRATAAAALLCAALASSGVAHAETADLNVNLVGAELETVIKTVGQLTNTTFIIDPRVKGTMNLVTEKPVSKSQLFQMLASHLRMQGMTVVQGDGFAKVLPEGDAKLQNSPTITPSHNVPKGDQIVTQIFRLNYESSMNLVTILRPLISPNNTINANPGNNTLVITDYADNLSRLGKIIAALDAPATVDVDIIPVKHAVAADIATMVNRMMEPAGAGADSGRVSLVADPRTNSLLLRAPSTARANMAKTLIGKLDQPTKNPNNVHVVYLKNADATKLAQTLRGIISGDTSAAASSNSSSSGLSPNQPNTGQVGGSTPPPPPSSNSGSANAGLSSGGPAGFIQADPSTNTLIITASEAQYKSLRAVIDQLDQRRAQVYIESLIVEVTSDRAAEFGIQWAALSGNSKSDYRVLGAANSMSSSTPLTTLLAGKNAVTGSGLALGIVKQDAASGKLTLGALARAMESEDGVNILSTPNVITLDNEEAKVIVGQNVPFITGQYTNNGQSSGSTVNPFQTIDRKDVGLNLKVKPQITEGGTVRMAIYQESSSLADNTQAGVITKKRSIETNVLADDGQIVVLGGLIEDSNTENMEKVPGLGDIPVLGNLFKYQKRKRNKTNLLVFLRPIILKTQDQNNALAYDRYDYIRARQHDAQPQNRALPNFGAPQLQELKDGVPQGANLAKPVPPAPSRLDKE